ncbi:MAG TPA: hypothetical protein VGC55_02160 [Dokdonella sp.]
MLSAAATSRDVPPSTRFAASRSARFALLLVLLVLFLLRIPYVDTHIDLARDMFVAHRLLSGQEFPLAGPILAGTIHLGPVWYYLLAALLALGGSWIGTMALLFAIAALQVPLAYLAGKAAHSRSAGLLWACGLAIPCWSTFELVLPLHFVLSAPLLLAFVLSALRYVKRPRLKYLVAMSLGFVLALHAHPANAGLVWILIGVVVWAVRRRACSARELAIALGVASLPLLPYLAWDWMHGFADMRAGLAFVGDAQQTGAFAAVLPLFGAVAWGGTEYWLHDVLMWRPLAATSTVMLIDGIGLLGLLGCVLAGRRAPSRPLILVAVAAVVAMLLTIALMRRYTPYYMTTPLRVELLGLVAIGLAMSGARPFARALRAAFIVIALTLATVALAAGIRLQTRAALPFAVLPLFDVAAPAQAAAAFPFVPAYAMSASGHFLCDEAAAIHGAYAQRLLHDYAIEQRLTCARGDVRLGGSAADRSHWVGLSRAMLAELGREPERRIGPIGLLRAQPIAPALAVLPPDVPVYPPVKPAGTPREERRFSIRLRRHEHVAITNIAFLLVADAAVAAALDGRALAPDASDAATRVYSCRACTGQEATLELVVESADFAYLDIVKF